MHGALFALPCPDCGSAMEIDVHGIAWCAPCGRAYLTRFGHLIAISRNDIRHDRTQGSLEHATRGRSPA